MNHKLRLMIPDRKYVIFDFDGTIADTLELAFPIYNRIAPEYSVQQVSRQELELLRSRKLQDVMKSYGLSRLRLLSLLLRMRKEMSPYRRSRNDQGMGDSLKEIGNAGFRLGILTSNSRKNVIHFLQHHSLSGIIDFVYSGNNFFGKEMVIRRMLERENIARDSVVYVGDETRDIEACKKAGISVIAVSWGLNSRDILASLNPDHLADDPEELLPYVRNFFRSA